MIDPLSALAAVKAGISAGKQLHSMSKEISSFFDSVDGAKKAHNKKKNNIFASANEEALATWTENENAKTAENELREFIIAVKGYSAYQELLKLRREIAAQRKEQEKIDKQRAEERQEFLLTCAIIAMGVLLMSGVIVFFMVQRGVIDI